MVEELVYLYSPYWSTHIITGCGVAGNIIWLAFCYNIVTF